MIVSHDSPALGLAPAVASSRRSVTVKTLPWPSSLSTSMRAAHLLDEPLA